MKTKTTKTNIPFHRTEKFKIGSKAAEIILFSLLFSATTKAAFASEITPQNIENLVNNERIYRGIKPLKSNPMLETASENKARDMVLRNYFSIMLMVFLLGILF